MGRYKVLTGEFADLMLGYYGETIGPRDPEVVAAAAKHAKKEPITGRPADLLKPEWDELAAPGPGPDGLQRHRRGRADLRHVPAGGPEVLRHAGGGPQERRQGPGASRPARQAAAGRQARRRQGPGHEPRHLRGPGRRQVPQGDRRARLSRRERKAQR